MNDTKWNEIFLAFYENECCTRSSFHVCYRTKDINGQVSDQDSAWEHFGCIFPWYKDLEWMQIALTEENNTFVIETLKSIHVHGIIQKEAVIIFGYKQDCDYI